jgi:uncharacterized protein (TIGR00299 family) protein
MKVLVIDPRTSGVGGDALLAALVDLLGTDDALAQAADAVRGLDACRDLSYAFREAESEGITATRLDLRLDGDPLPVGPALRDVVTRVSGAAGLSGKGTETALRTLDDLLAASARLHRSTSVPPAPASLESLFEIVGSLRLLESGGFLDGEVYGLPPSPGSGATMTESGPLALPVPATVEILCCHRVPWSGAGTGLTTPAGAAIFANIVEPVTEVYPSMTPVRAGYGIGSRECAGLLRVVEGTDLRAIADRIVMLETNLDDVSGEVIGYTVERLREAGAVDVFVTPAYGKKNRPVQVVHVITGPAEYQKLLAILMEETGTLGVRVLDQPRLVAERTREARRVAVGGRAFEVRVKTSTVDGRVIAVKPEFEDLRRIAIELGRPLRSVDDEIRAQLAGWNAR